MHIDNFEAYLTEKKISLNSAMQFGVTYSQCPKVAGAYKYWEEVACDIQPHIEGTMPKVIAAAFPNETKPELDYRLSIYQSATKSLLTKAVADTNRVIMSPQFMMQYGEKLDAWLTENPRAFDGVDTHLSLQEYLSTVVYPARVKDPNAWLAVLPTNIAPMVYDEKQQKWISEPNKLQKTLGVKCVIYTHDNVVWISNDIMIFAEPQIPENITEAAFDTMIFQVFYRVITPNSSFLYNPNGVNTGEKFSEFYQPKTAKGQPAQRNYLPVTRLGGKLSTRKVGHNWQTVGINIAYYESDFSYACPAMKELEIKNSQLNVITNKAIYPTTARRRISCRAHGCNSGKVAILNPETRHPIIDENGLVRLGNCQSCNGTGEVKLSAQSEIIVPELTTAEQSGNPPKIDDYVKSFPPDTTAVKEIREQVDAWSEKVRSLLTIIQQKVVGQSAESKEADEQDKYALLHQAANGMARIADCILRSTCYYVVPENEWQKEIAQIHVATPRSFKIHSIEMLRALRDDNREKKSLHTRAMESLMLLEAESNDPKQVRILELLQAYTNELCEATLTELDALDAHSDITKEQKLAALYGGAQIQKILNENSQIEESEVFDALDNFFAEMVKKLDISAEFRAGLVSAQNETQPPIADPQSDENQTPQ